MRPEIRLSIGQPSADCTLDRALGPLGVVYPELDAVAVPEIELAQVARKVLFRTVLIHADHPALEDAEIAFNGVGRDLAAFMTATTVFLGAVIDRFVIGKLAARRLVDVEIVGMQDALARGRRDQHGTQRVLRQVFDLDRASAPKSAALYQRHDLHLFRGRGANPALTVYEGPFRAASRTDEGFVRLDDLAGSAKRPFVIAGAVHCLANAMRHEPRGAIGTKADRPHELMRREALLRCGVEPEPEHPLVQWNVRTL